MVALADRLTPDKVRDIAARTGTKLSREFLSQWEVSDRNRGCAVSFWLIAHVGKERARATLDIARTYISTDTVIDINPGPRTLTYSDATAYIAARDNGLNAPYAVGLQHGFMGWDGECKAAWESPDYLTGVEDGHQIRTLL
jgi:sugar phosphate isomerase/epimerase